MHMVIRVLTFAKNKEDALDNAKGVLEGLCGEGKVFDYATTFDEDGHKVSGKDRWGSLAPVTRICLDFNKPKCETCRRRFKCYTSKVNEMVVEGLEATKAEFREHLEEVKKAILSKTTEELFEDNTFKYHLESAGRGEGWNVWLYDQDGEGITDTAHLNNVLNKWRNLNSQGEVNEYEKLNLYVVPADVHY